MQRSRGLLAGIVVATAILITAGLELRHARTVTSELAAEAHIRAIHAEQARFLDQFGRYASTLSELGVPGTTDGYKFALAKSGRGYAISADPMVFNRTGRRTFFSDQTRTIHQNWGSQPANARSPELN